MKYFPYADENQKKFIAMTARNAANRLSDRFRFKIYDAGPENFYLSFSGGFESYLLYWFIRLSGMFDDGYKIRIVSVVNSMFYPQVMQRIMECADTVLYPSMTLQDVKDIYGIPCFNKRTDGMIHRYQSGSRRRYLMNNIYGTDTKYFRLNNTAGSLLMNGKLHKVSPYCCVKTKEEPLNQYGLEQGKRPIIGVRKSNSMLRNISYRQCMQKSGEFCPLYDFTNLECLCMYDSFNIEKIYPYTRDYYHLEQVADSGKCSHLTGTGCLGCPYAGEHLYKEFPDMMPAQRQYAIKYFHESYDTIGFDYARYL